MLLLILFMACAPDHDDTAANDCYATCASVTSSFCEWAAGDTTYDDCATACDAAIDTTWQDCVSAYGIGKTTDMCSVTLYECGAHPCDPEREASGTCEE